MSTFRFSLLLVSLALGGCASPSHNPQDPFESFNRGMYKFNDTVDKAVVKPMAKGYNAVVPPPGRMMLSNFFSNLNDVVVTVNDLLQFKLVQAVSDTGRVVVNSTIGMFGLVDVASQVGLKKHNEDFGQTLGRWGVASGPYLVLPLLGPSSIRDGIGLYADSNASIVTQVKHVETRNQAIGLNLLGKRANLLSQESLLNEAALDRYTFMREAFLQNRQNLVYDGNPPRKKYDDDFEDDFEEDNSGSSMNELPAPTIASIQLTPVADDESIITSVNPASNAQPVLMRLWLPASTRQQ